MEYIAKIFDSTARVKIMRLFLFNPRTTYDLIDIVERSKVSRSLAQREIKMLVSTGFLKKHLFTKEFVTARYDTEGNPIIKKKRVEGYHLNPDFPLNKPLKALLIDSGLIQTKDLHVRLGKAGKIKLLVLSGVFLKDEARSADMIVVGEKLDTKKLERMMRTLESEIGKELRYSVFSPEEFRYRMDMYDQHLLDIFEYPYELIVDKIGLNP